MVHAEMEAIISAGRIGVSVSRCHPNWKVKTNGGNKKWPGYLEMIQQKKDEIFGML